jgi:hypothetical protein
MLEFMRGKDKPPPEYRQGAVPMSIVEKIVSGGQTGADRAALNFALEHGIPHGGWCPRGRLAEDGTIDARYVMTETPSADPAQRTEWNVRDSDGTVIFSIARKLTGGSQLTAAFAHLHHKPCLHLSRRRDGAQSAEKLRGFLEAHRIKVLNVAGPRQSGESDVGKFARQILEEILGGKCAGNLRFGGG